MVEPAPQARFRALTWKTARPSLSALWERRFRAVKRLHPAVLGISACFIIAFGAWLTLHSAGNYTTCTGLGLFGPGDCGFYRNATIVGAVIGAFAIGLGIWSLVLLQKASTQNRAELAPFVTPQGTVQQRVVGTTAPVVAAPAWYPHPQKPGHLAYWDGQAWTWDKPPDAEAQPI
jgi:hypothetical protein